jgi:RND family efflux transporter MFP subunit
MGMKNKVLKWVITIAVIAVAGIAAMSIIKNVSQDRNNKKDQGTAADTTTYVTAQKPKAVKKVSGIKFKSTFEPSEEGIVSGSMPGKAVRILFKNGDYVTQGQVLVSLDDMDYQNQMKSLRVNLKKAQMAVDAATKNLSRTNELYSAGASTSVEIDNLQRTLDLAKLDREAISISMSNLNDTISNTIIKAPISGVIDEKAISRGQYVSPGMVLAKVKNVSMLNAIIQVEQNGLKDIRVGQAATVSVDGFDGLFKGVVDSKGVSANEQSRATSFKVRVDNSRGQLKPGLYGVVEIKSGMINVMEVPLKALGGTEENYYVFLNRGGKVNKASVKIGDIGGDKADVLSGIGVDDEVIVSNLNTLQEGDRITVSGKGE